jgi:hypothetical protein
MAMNATISSLALPHDPLTKIAGKPAHPAVMELHKELFESAMSVGNADTRHGHACCATQCHARCPQWVNLPNPGALQLPANAVQHHLAMLTDMNNRNTKERSSSLPS